MNRRGQVTIFIIIAIVIVTVILLFVFLRKEINPANPQEENPKSFIQGCVKDAVENSLYKITWIIRVEII